MSSRTEIDPKNSHETPSAQDFLHNVAEWTKDGTIKEHEGLRAQFRTVELSAGESQAAFVGCITVRTGEDHLNIVRAALYVGQRTQDDSYVHVTDISSDQHRQPLYGVARMPYAFRFSELLTEEAAYLAGKPKSLPVLRVPSPVDLEGLNDMEIWDMQMSSPVLHEDPDRPLPEPYPFYVAAELSGLLVAQREKRLIEVPQSLSVQIGLHANARSV